MGLSSILAVRVTPKSRRPGIGEWRALADGREALELRVRAAPEGGKANEEVLELLAQALGVPRREVEIVSGETGRLKRVSIPLPESEARVRLG